MKHETIVAIVSSSPRAVEITQEELDLIMKKREKDAHTAKRQSYIAEMNDLFARASKDGFTFATEKVESIHRAKDWGDAAGNWIKVF